MLARVRQAIADALRRLRQFGRMHRPDRPAALVIRGQAAGDLCSLEREVEGVRRALKAMDYDVLVVSDGTKEAFDSVLSTDFRSRLVILHYAGHATDEGFIIEDGRGGDWLLRASDFARLFEIATSLRLIFLNGCWAFWQLQAYENALVAERSGSIDCCVIGSLNEIGDELAADFAMAVYESLADNATLEDATRNVGNFVISLDYNEDAAAGVAVVLNGQGDFRLSDGWPLIFIDLYENGRNFSFNPLLVYVVVLSAIGVTSAYFAHGPLSSPAFQAAFSIPPNHVIKDFVEAHGKSESLRAQLGYLPSAEGPTDALVHFGRICTAGPPPGADGVVQGARTLIANALDFNEHYGWMVEGGRVLLLAALLLVVVNVAQQTRFPRRVPLLAIGEFADLVRYPIGAAFLATGLLGGTYIVHYHLVTAPANLAKFDTEENGGKSWQERRWALVHCIPEAWNEGSTKEGPFFRKVVKPHQGDSGLRVWKSFVDTPEGDANRGIFYHMYQQPYLVYLPYSLTTFVGLLLPSLYIMFLTCFQSFQWCRMAAAGVRVQLRDWARNRERIEELARQPDSNRERIETLAQQLKSNRERIERLARQLERRSKEATRIFSAIMFGFCIAAIYEAYLGKNTIAVMARTSTVVAILLVVFAAGLVTMLIAGLTQLKQKVREEVEDRDREFSQQLTGFMSLGIHPGQWLVVAATGAVVFRLVQLLFR